MPDAYQRDVLLLLSRLPDTITVGAARDSPALQVLTIVQRLLQECPVVRWLTPATKPQDKPHPASATARRHPSWKRYGQYDLRYF